MTIDELINRFEASNCNYTDEIGIEVNGVTHDIQVVKSGPGGLILVVDSFEEERAMRQQTLEDYLDPRMGEPHD